MKTYEIAIIVVAILILLFIFQLATAKWDKKRIAIMNSEGRTIQLDVEVANKTATRTRGLMGRESLGEYEGMLFVFDWEARHSFWMLNTTVPLDAIYISGNGSVVDVIEMEPCGLNVTMCRFYTPKEKARYVLEVNRGFSEKNRIIAGRSRIDGLD